MPGDGSARGVASRNQHIHQIGNGAGLRVRRAANLLVIATAFGGFEVADRVDRPVLGDSLEPNRERMICLWCELSNVADRIDKSLLDNVFRPDNALKRAGDLA